MSYYICGVFYAEKKGEESRYLNIKGKSSGDKFQTKYWKNIAVTFGSAKVSNPNAKLLLFTNIEPPNEFLKIYQDIGLKLIIIEYLSKPRNNNWDAWQSTFFIIDAMKYLEKYITTNDSVFFVDVDCLIIKPMDKLIELNKKSGILRYPLWYKENEKIHSKSRKDIQANYEKANRTSMNNTPLYYGGEFYGFYGRDMMLEVLREIDIAMRIAEKNEDYLFKTEEHLFNFIFCKYEINRGHVDKYIKRIWTSYKFRNVKENDLKLTIWHLPAEKNNGLLKLYNEMENKNSWFWLYDQEWIRRLGHYVSIPHRTKQRLFNDNLKTVINVIRQTKKRILK